MTMPEVAFDPWMMPSVSAVPLVESQYAGVLIVEGEVVVVLVGAVTTLVEHEEIPYAGAVFVELSGLAHILIIDAVHLAAPLLGGEPWAVDGIAQGVGGSHWIVYLGARCEAEGCATEHQYRGKQGMKLFLFIII